jgi:hypothetical protein
MNTLIGEGTMQIGGAERPFYIGTRQTAIFCELQKGDFDLQDYNNLLGQVVGNSLNAAQAREGHEAYAPAGRKELKPGELRDFIYSALAAGAKRAGYSADFDPDTIADWIDEAESTEVVKPLTLHIRLLAQRLARQAERPGNVPAPALKATRGGKATAKKSK